MVTDSLITEAKNLLSEHGGRMTSQRKLILETLQSMAGHPTADELYTVVSQTDPGIHLSTIYRTLRWLEQERLVNTRLFNEDRGQIRYDPGTQNEHHFVCTICHQVIEFSTPLCSEIIATFEKETGAKVNNGSVVLRGVCAECLEKTNQPREDEVTR